MRVPPTTVFAALLGGALCLTRGAASAPPPNASAMPPPASAAAAAPSAPTAPPAGAGVPPPATSASASMSASLAAPPPAPSSQVVATPPGATSAQVAASLAPAPAAAVPPTPSATSPTETLSTRQLRERQRVTIRLGFEPDFLGSHFALASAYHLSGFMLLEAELSVGRRAIFAPYSHESFTLRGRVFPADSFFLSAGLKGRRMTRWNPSSDAREEASDGGLDVGVGNEWRYGAFVFGIEWAGYYKALVSGVYEPVVTRTTSSFVVDASDIDAQTSADVRLFTLWLGGAW